MFIGRIFLRVFFTRMSETEYKEGDHSEFVQYLFSDSPKEQGAITLELPLNERGKSISLHVFEQLLMIFVDGMKYFYGKDGKVDITSLKREDIEKVNEYFVSMNFKVNMEIFPTLNEYKFKFPDYFKNKEHITPATKLEEFFYEIYGHESCAYRISFSELP